MGSKRGQNEGSICLTKNGKWRAQVTVGGRRLSANKDTKKEAQLWLRQTLSQVDKGLTYTAAITPLWGFPSSFWRTRRISSGRPPTSSISRVMTKYILPAIGHVSGSRT
jgi:hypothetical protein